MIFDGCGGPGGWEEALKLLGRSGVGVEIEPWACRTAKAAGHERIRADVSTFPLTHLRGKVEGVIFSPPCKVFSAAGSGDGIRFLPDLVSAVDRGEWWARPDPDPLVWLVLEPLRWVTELGPEWVAMEQVPQVLPIWQAYKRRLRMMGYSTQCAVLSAERYGVPQVRKRAIFVAHRTRTACMPEPSHQAHGADETPSLWGGVLPRPVSMAEALGWDGFVDRRTNSRGPNGSTVRTVTVDTDRPSPTVLTGTASGQWVYHRSRGSGMVERHGPRADQPADQPAPTITSKVRSDVWLNPGLTDTRPNRRLWSTEEPAPTVAFGHDVASWAWERPSTTVCTTPRIAKPGHKDRSNGGESQCHESIPITIAEAGILQSFREDYPWQGSKSKQAEQVGNCIPPLLAKAVLACLL